MFQVGDYVFKIPDGICRIESIGHPDISGIRRNQEYYVLIPASAGTSRILLPIGMAEERLRGLMSREEAMGFIRSLPEIRETELQNEKAPEQEYRTVIMSGDNRKLAGMLRLLYRRRQERTAQGRKATTTDDRYFKQAEDMLHSELSFALQLPKESIGQFIADTIGG